jgi:hypothetical protein
MDWYEQTVGSCPHQGIKPYCPQCAGDRLKAKAQAKKARERKRTPRGSARPSNARMK